MPAKTDPVKKPAAAGGALPVAVAAAPVAEPGVPQPVVAQPVVAQPVVVKAAAPEPAAKPVAAKPAAKVAEKVAAKPTVKPAVKPVAVKPAVKPVAVKPVAPAAASANRPKPVLASITNIFKPSTKEKIMATAFETNPEKIVETIKSSVSQLNTSGKAAMEQITAKSKEAVENSMKSVDEMTDMARGNVEALLASARAASAGIEAIATHVSAASKKSFEEASAVAQSMTGVKNPNELFQLQSDFAKTQFDQAVSEFSKMTEMLVKMSGEVMEPVQNRVAIATDKIKTKFAK